MYSISFVTENFENNIVILDEVLSHHECEKLIDSYKPTKRWWNTFPMSIRDGYAMEIAKKIERHVNKFFQDKVEIDWCEVVRWPIGSYQELHVDDASQQTILTSITYLNNNYLGGETYIENDIKMIPKIGRTVCFDGQYYKHGVTEIKNSDRFTLPIWYKIKQASFAKHHK